MTARTEKAKRQKKQKKRKELSQKRVNNDENSPGSVLKKTGKESKEEKKKEAVWKRRKEKEPLQKEKCDMILPAESKMKEKEAKQKILQEFSKRTSGKEDRKKPFEENGF